MSWSEKSARWAELTAIFRQYGLPEGMLMDNGSPCGSDALHRKLG